MIVSIDMPDDVIVSLVVKAAELRCSLEQAIIQQCTSPESLLVELSDEDIDAKLNEWATFAINEYEYASTFTLLQLVQAYEGVGVWNGYSTSTRKKLGKRFKALILDFTHNGHCLLVSGKTITNSTLYAVRPV